MKVTIIELLCPCSLGSLDMLSTINGPFLEPSKIEALGDLLVAKKLPQDISSLSKAGRQLGEQLGVQVRNGLGVRARV